MEREVEGLEGEASPVPRNPDFLLMVYGHSNRA